MIHADTHRLTRASLELSCLHERRRRTATFVTVVVMLVLAGGGAFYLRGADLPFTGTSGRLAQENAALLSDVQRLRTELDMEKATRAELNRQAVELQTEINELTNRLEFLAARDGRVNQPR